MGNLKNKVKPLVGHVVKANVSDSKTVIFELRSWKLSIFCTKTVLDWSHFFVSQKKLFGEPLELITILMFCYDCDYNILFLKTFEFVNINFMQHFLSRT